MSDYLALEYVFKLWAECIPLNTTLVTHNRQIYTLTENERLGKDLMEERLEEFE